MKSRLFITRNGKSYKVASFDYNKEDASIYLFVPNRKNTPGKRGITEMSSQPGSRFRVDITKFEEDVNYDHFSVHGSGIEHSRVKEGEAIDRSQWRPLKGLKKSRHLWTLVLPDVTGFEEDPATRARDLKVEYPANMTGCVIDVFAVPRKNINFNVEYVESNERPTIHTFGHAMWNLGEYKILVYSRSSDKHEGSPERTLKISLPEDFVPLVTTITPDYVEGVVAKLVYSENLNHHQ